MQDYLSKLNEKYPIRRKKEQKEEFFNYVCENFEPNRVKKDVLDKNENIVIGDWEKADVIITAHYDTPASSIFPNVMMPRNIILSYAYHLGIPILMALVCLAFAFFISAVFKLEYIFTVYIYLVLYFGLFYFGMRFFVNKHNYNDNTSGVATVMELAKLINSEKVAFILFDNEEKGLVGSKAMAKKYKEQLSGKLVINLDCVANGKEILFIVKKGAEECKEYSLLKQSFNKTDEFTPHFFPFKGSSSNSDHKSFDRSIGVMACSKGKFAKFVTGKIHTEKDVLVDKNNITYLVDAFVNFLQKI